MLVVPFEALQIKQIKITNSKTPVSKVVGQSDQPIGYFIVLSVALALVAITNIADAKTRRRPVCKRPDP